MADKPISMLVKETKTNLIQGCNESKLHISVLQLIIKEMYDEISKVAQRVMEEEEVEYQSTMAQEQSSEEVKQ